MGLEGTGLSEEEVKAKVQDVSALAREAHRTATDLTESHDFTGKQAS